MLLPFLTNRLYRVGRWADDSGQMHHENTVEEVFCLNNADIVSSELLKRRLILSDDSDDGLACDSAPMHTPVLDIDIPAQLVQSTTPGKHHLYIDAPMTWDVYVKLLDVMAEAGILEQGYVNASKARGFTAVRLPWIRKETGSWVNPDAVVE